LKISHQAKIVTAPRDWRSYLLMDYETEITPPPRVLWPKNPDEQLEWNSWVKEGWQAGYEQGDEIFNTGVAQMVSDYRGMVRYRMLLAQGKISQPYALHEDRGVTGGRDEMRVGDRALRITGPSQFLTGADLWKPADR
jgi:defect in organelle trafficking protein DotC